MDGAITKPTVPRASAVPPRQGRFELLRRLGVGGMGEVWIARAPGEPLVAIKRMLPNLAHDRRAAQMFLDEARIASKLDHPNVVRILEVDHDEEVQWFAMELLMGENVGKLAERARKKRLPIAAPVAARVIMEAAEGVHHAHTRTDARGRPLGIIHRDVTPPNIMVTDDGQVKVLDFGIAKAIERVARTEAGSFKGKVEYLSPEQILGAELDHRIDIFSLGTVLFELLTGKKLFARASMVATLAAITDCRVPPPSRVNPAVPRELDEITLAALTRNPDERYGSAAALAEALGRYLRAARPPADLLTRWVSSLCPEEQAERRRLAAPAVRRAESLVEGPALAEVLQRAFEDNTADDDAPFVDFAAGSEAPTQLSRVRPEVSEAIDPILTMEPRTSSHDGRLEAELGSRTDDEAPIRLVRSRPPPPPLTHATVRSAGPDLEETETGTPAEARTAPATPHASFPPDPPTALGAETVDDDDDRTAREPPELDGFTPARLVDDVRWSPPPLSEAAPPERSGSRLGLVLAFAALTLAGAVAGGGLVYRAHAPEDAPAIEEAPAAQPRVVGAASPARAPASVEAASSTRTLDLVAVPAAQDAPEEDGDAGAAPDAAPSGRPRPPAATPVRREPAASPSVRAEVTPLPRREATRTATRSPRRPRARPTPAPIGPDDVDIEVELD